MEMAQEKKRSPNRLVVDDIDKDDSSVIYLNPEKLTELNIFRGDSVLLKGKRGKTTICVALDDENVEMGKIRMHKVTRKNIYVRLGDLITLKQAPEVPYGKKVSNYK